MPARIASRARRGDRPAPGGSDGAGTLKEELRMQPIDSATLANKDYGAEQYRRYKADPRSVGEEWALFFAGFELGPAATGRRSARRRRARPPRLRPPLPSSESSTWSTPTASSGT